MTQSRIAPDDKMPLPYWRAALAEASLLHPDVPPDSRALDIAPQGTAWRVTAAHPDVHTWAAAQFAASKARPDALATIPFVLVAARLSATVSHGVKQHAEDVHKGLSVLCLPCRLDRDGGLAPDPDRPPWIPRDLLEPTVRHVAVGHLDDQDQFITRLPARATAFGDVLQLAADLFLAVTGARLPLLPATAHPDTGDLPPVLACDGHALVSGWHGLPWEPPVIPARLIRLCDQILQAPVPLPLFDNLRTTSARRTRPPVALRDAEQDHQHLLGHIHREHPLSPSQREAMVELGRLRDGELLAVNGPPGTGKTTLIQSAVAQLWIEAALAEAACPLIVVVSTNARAVENVLDSFARLGVHSGHRRWHPYGGGFGLFLAADARESAHPLCTSRHHAQESWETPDAVASAERHYLAQATDLFQHPHQSVDEVVAALHGLLTAYRTALQQIVAARHAVFRATGEDPSEGAATACERCLESHRAQVERARADWCEVEDQAAALRLSARAAATDHEATWHAIDRVEQAWNAHLAAAPLWLDLLGFLPAIRRRQRARDRAFLVANPLTADRQHRDDGLAAHFDGLRRRALARKSTLQADLDRQRAALDARLTETAEQRRLAEQGWAAIDEVFTRWRDALNNGQEHLLDVSLQDLQARLDLGLRAPMFRIADWYWSGRWLLEMKARLRTGETDSRGRTRLEAKYRRLAKLSPCLVSNFHIAPSFFTAWQGDDLPFWNTIDLLVVDEAGQVSPEVGAGLFALARRALVVGDTHQIEPVWNTGEATDRANAVRHGLLSAPHDARYETLAGAGYSPASGNLMRMANRRCAVQRHDDLRGLLLTEHRRCVPELVAYCNRLIYAGRLEPRRPSLPEAERVLPAFGYWHVPGRDQRRGASRHNPTEARAIAQWLKARRAGLERHYRDASGSPTPLWQLVGIVTPFASQAGAIEQALRAEMPDLVRRESRLTVGTVHALQGSERAIVIFSPTYGTAFNGAAFFDQKPNMLNVAVSRAKDSFVVIGNLTLFNEGRPGRPSGLLASFLFREGEDLAPEHAAATAEQLAAPITRS